MSKRLTVLVTGASGLVGSRIAQMLSPIFNVLTPGRKILDITNADGVTLYMKQNVPSVVIHAAAFTDVQSAEKERGDTKGLVWKTNVEGTRNINNAAKQVGAFHIFISTGSVFAGTKDKSGPFTEADEPAGDSSKLTWYGWTKRMAEIEVQGAIIRISHPGYLSKLIFHRKRDPHIGFYTDQLFPLTSFTDLARAIERLIIKRQRGVFHVASPDLVSPYELVCYYCQHMGLPTNNIITQKCPKKTLYHAINSSSTARLLGLRFASWRHIADRMITNSFQES